MRRGRSSTRILHAVAGWAVFVMAVIAVMFCFWMIYLELVFELHR
jgi:uncharacterized membrane protein